MSSPANDGIFVFNTGILEAELLIATNIVQRVLWLESSSYTINNSRFEMVTGAIKSGNGSTGVVTDSIFINCSNEIEDGAGIHDQGGSISVDNTVF